MALPLLVVAAAALGLLATAALSLVSVAGPRCLRHEPGPGANCVTERGPGGRVAPPPAPPGGGTALAPALRHMAPPPCPLEPPAGQAGAGAPLC